MATIISYRADLRPHFERLNRDWIEQYFTVEAADEAEFRDPEATFITPGGQIFFALDERETVVGVCAVAPVLHGGGPGREFGLAKMAVAPEARGRGYGDLLLGAAVAFAREAGASAVTLVSNRRLTPALRLYAKHGFREVPLDPDEEYSRADIKMRLDLMPAELIEGFRPGYLGRIAQMHGEYYAVAWGAGTGFEALQARELCDFHDAYDPGRDLLLTAHIQGKLVGSIAIDGSVGEHPGVRLRWFLLEEAYQGLGIGSALMRRALEFCRERRFARVMLWTVEGLPQSWKMYERAGFRVVERYSDASFTVDQVHVRMEMALD